MSNQSAMPVTSASATTSTAVEAATSGGKGAGKGITSSTTISSLAELKEKAPQIYNELLKSIAMDICIDMQRSQDRLKQMQDEANR